MKKLLILTFIFISIQYMSKAQAWLTSTGGASPNNGDCINHDGNVSIGSGPNKLAFGYGFFNNATSWIGFNWERVNNCFFPGTTNGQFVYSGTSSAAGSKNGANLIYGTLEGDLHFVCKPNTANGAGINSEAGMLANSKMKLLSNGKLIIGDVNPNTYGVYGLYVKDGILTEQVKVAIKTTSDWSDYVFKPTYKLMSLNEVETFIKKNKHLPNVPSAEDVVKEGVNMAQMDAKLLEKIEELTLYTIELNKQVKALQEKLSILENEN